MTWKRTALLLLGLLCLGCGSSTMRARESAGDQQAQDAGIPKWVLGLDCIGCPLLVGTAIGATVLVVKLSQGRRSRRAVRPAVAPPGGETGGVSR
jgi:hypothetical protein